MSASEKLRAAAPWGEWREWCNRDVMDMIETDDMDRLLNALPQIVAVVEAAQEAVRFDSITSSLGIEPARRLYGALIALDEALS